MADHQSFQLLYQKYYQKVSATVHSYRFRDAAADDIIQDVFIQAWDKLDSLQNPEAFGGWISTIARNRCLNEIRSMKKVVPIATAGKSDEEFEIELSYSDEDQVGIVHYEKSIELLRLLIKNHPREPQGSVARMFYLENRSVKEIGIALEMKVSTVLSHLRRFRLIVSKSITKLVEEEGIELQMI